MKKIYNFFFSFFLVSSANSVKSPANAQPTSSNGRLPPILASSIHVGYDAGTPECQTQTRPRVAKGNDGG